MSKASSKKVDRFFATILILLVCVGLAMFFSASLGTFAKNEKIFYGVLLSQFALGLGGGLLGMYLTLKMDYKIWRKYAFYIFVVAILLTLAVFLPGVGTSHGGATRWVSLGPISFQPAEILKFAFILYFAVILQGVKDKVKSFKFGILPFLAILAIIAGVLLKQPDTKSFILITLTGLGMLFISEVPIKYILGVSLGAVILLGGLIFSTPYLQERVKTFINPAQDAQGSSYQIQQSLIAIGSGGVLGRGYGQSIQKFSYLPEPQGDSIFAVIGEEFGLVGSTIVILLYLLFALSGLKIGKNAPDSFGRLLVAGIVIMITAQSFMHIASITGVFPLTGVPLPFMSHGGTSLAIYLTALGIVLQISKVQKKNI